MKILELAHKYWSEILLPGDLAIDATVGNGKDTFALAKILQGKGKIIGYDIQEQALENAKALTASYNDCITYFLRSHETFEATSAKLIVYNLGYLPGGDKSLTTKCATTLQSLQNAIEILVGGGALSIMCYPGHKEGAEEEKAILAWCKKLEPEKWTVCFHKWINRDNAPSLLLVRRH